MIVEYICNYNFISMFFVGIGVLFHLLKNTGCLFTYMDANGDVKCIEYGNLWKAAAGSSGPAVAQMEQELNQVRSLMEGLSTQGSKLSETMQNMKPPVADAVPPSSSGWQFDNTEILRYNSGVIIMIIIIIMLTNNATYSHKADQLLNS